jgi:adenylate cyclase
MTLKLTLRATLTTILVSLLLLTMGSFGISFYRNARFTAENLSTQILDQNSRMVDFQINELLHVANEQGRTNLRLLQAGTFRTDRFADLGRYWANVMEVHPRLARLSIAFEETGEWFVVDRRGGKIAFNELKRNRSSGKLEYRSYRPDGYPDHPDFVDLDQPDADPRLRPWYAEAKASHRQEWSETYILYGSKGEPELPGITCATPIVASDGTFQGVLGAGFDVIGLSMYLRSLTVGSNGYAFVVECRDDGTRRVVAHKEPKLLIRKAKPRPGNQVTAIEKTATLELVPTQELADPRVPAFLAQIPGGLVPSKIRGTTRIAFELDGVRYLGAYSCLSNRETPDWLICLVMPESDVLAQVYESNRATFGIGVLILVVAIGIGLLVAAQVARPLERIALETEAIGRIQLQPQAVAHSIVKEVDRLAEAVEQTKTSLRSFRKYVPAELIQRFHSTGLEAGLGGECRRMSVSFCDIANFTTLSESLPPEELVRHLADYFGPLSADVTATGGTVDKYIGDAIMAYWGAPAPNPDHAAAACESALRNQASLEALRIRWRLEGKPELFARVGIQTGDAIVGNIGSEARLNYTVMGDTVNLASRLEGLGKVYGANILIGESTYREARDRIIARPVDRVTVQGKTEGMMVYELLAMKTENRPDLEELARLSNLALEAYQARDWETALDYFAEIASPRPALPGVSRITTGGELGWRFQDGRQVRPVGQCHVPELNWRVAGANRSRRKSLDGPQ